jgi:hypothetical protein
MLHRLHSTQDTSPTAGDLVSGGMSASTRHLIRHYAEMVVAMFAGMAVLGLPFGWGLGAVGSSWHELTDTAPALMFLAMATTMTVPMVGWMAYRGHDRRANAEMSASMFVPTFGVIALLGAGVVSDIGALVVIEHVAMLLAMAGVMLLRPAAYTHHHADGQAHTHIETQQVTA